MNEIIKNFIDTKISEENAKHEAEKSTTLSNLGLYEKVYSPDNKYSAEYPVSELDSNNTFKYYKNKPIEISDEDYEELKKHLDKGEHKKHKTMALIFTVIAWIVFVGGFVAGISFANIVIDPYDVVNGTYFSFSIAFTYWSVSLISGTIILGFAEIIKILDDIKKKQLQK